MRETLAANLKMEKWILKYFTALSAELTSSAQRYDLDSLGPSESRLIEKTNGFIASRNSVALSGHPVLTPARTQKRKLFVPIPVEKECVMI